jgi:starch synthase (maltosyl-transferring)
MPQNFSLRVFSRLRVYTSASGVLFQSKTQNLKSKILHMTHPIKLTYLITDLKVGGVPLHLYRLATRLPRDEFEIRVVSLAEEGPVGQRLASAGIPVLACGARSPRVVWALVRLWRYLLADPPHILHAMLFHANMAARFVGPLAGLPARQILCEIQTVEVERRWHIPLDGWTCRLCRCEIGNSPSVTENLHRRAGIPTSRLRCEWGAVDVACIDSAPAADRMALGIASDEPLLLWTGRLDPVKGFEEMLAACSQLRTSHRFRLAIAGEGPYRAAVERLIAEHSLQDRVLLLGQRQDVPSLLKAADVFVFCSRTEGLPNSLLEAMAAGLPSVATNVPGCRDLIRHMQTGMLVEAGSSNQIACALIALLDNHDLRRQLGQAAREWARRNVDAELWCARWMEFYRGVRQQGI